MLEGGGQSDAFGGLVLQQLLQKVEEMPVLRSLGQHVLLEETQPEGRHADFFFFISSLRVCTCGGWLTAKGLHLALT